MSPRYTDPTNPEVVVQRMCGYRNARRHFCCLPQDHAGTEHNYRPFPVADAIFRSREVGSDGAA